jgi:hypothetical protein
LHPRSERLLGELVRDARDQGLVLFVGSGINARAVAQWGKLLEELLRRTIREASIGDKRVSAFEPYLLRWCLNHFDVCAQASIVKKILGTGRYRREIQDILYNGKSDIEARVKNYCSPNSDNEPKQEDKQFEFLRQVGRLCQLTQVRAVATFNFDTLLETAIDASGDRKAQAYSGEVSAGQRSLKAEKSMIPVFHLHGLLPPPGTLLKPQTEAVVFSYDEYFEKNADPLSWETATPLHLMRSFCTLWLGASLRDWNMMRLVDSARSGRNGVSSYCLQSLSEVKEELALQPPVPENPHTKTAEKASKRFPHEWAVLHSNLAAFRKVAMRFQATLHDMVGLKLIVGGDTFAQLPKAISAIAEKIPNARK